MFLKFSPTAVPILTGLFLLGQKLGCSRSSVGTFDQDRNAMAEHLPSAIASPNSAQEEERIPRVIVTSYVPGAIAISSVPQVQEQNGSSLGVVKQEAIAPVNSRQQEPETVSPVVVTQKVEGAIATKNIPQQAAILSKDISFPVPPLAKGEPVIPKKLSQEELDPIEDELKRLRDLGLILIRVYR